MSEQEDSSSEEFEEESATGHWRAGFWWPPKRHVDNWNELSGSDESDVDSEISDDLIESYADVNVG